MRLSNLTCWWQVSYPIFALVKHGSNVMAQTSYFQGHSPASRPTREPSRFGALTWRLFLWAHDWRRQFRRMRTEAELNRKLVDYDKHMLRDMGLMRTGDRIEPFRADRNPWG